MSEESDSDRQATTTTTDDQRFEVKWKKKSQSTPKVVEPSVVEGPAGDDDLRRELEASQQRIQELQDKWHRAAADLVNLRKRTEQERGEMEKFASMLLVSELLPVLDNFERALATVPGNLTMLTWIQGVMLIERHMSAILDHQGLAPIEAEGQQFNPQFHEAIGERETDDAAPGTIVQVYQKGYTMHGRIIRPSLVEVARAPAKPSGDEPVPADADSHETTDADAGEIGEHEAVENPEP